MHKYSERHYNKYTLQVVSRMSFTKNQRKSLVLSSPKNSKKQLRQTFHNTSAVNLGAYASGLNASRYKIATEDCLASNKPKQGKQLQKKTHSPVKIPAKYQFGTFPWKSSYLGQPQQRRQSPPRQKSSEKEQISDQLDSPFKKKLEFMLREPKENDYQQNQYYKKRCQAREELSSKREKYKKKELYKLNMKRNISQFKQEALLDQLAEIQQDLRKQLQQTKDQIIDLEIKRSRLDEVEHQYQIHYLDKKKLRLQGVVISMEKMLFKNEAKYIAQAQENYREQQDEFDDQQHQIKKRYSLENEIRAYREKYLIKKDIQKDL